MFSLVHRFLELAQETDTNLDTSTTARALENLENNKAAYASAAELEKKVQQQQAEQPAKSVTQLAPTQSVS